MRSWDWIPGVAVGELIFGAVLHPDDFDFHLELLPRDDGTDWDTYRMEDEMARISTEEGRIISVECVTSLKLDDHELLGCEVSEVNHFLPTPATLHTVYECGDERWECEKLGLTLWVENGVVESATVSSSWAT